MTKNKNTIIIPTRWVGHATALVIKKSENGGGLYDLAFINTGHGLRHHHHQPDPNEVYPHLSRLWLEFKDVPKDLIFDPETAWFFYALYSISDRKSAGRLIDSLKDKGSSLPSYMYGTVLANFKDYLVEPKYWSDFEVKLFPEQQSGSCTMSSLIGTLLYYSESMEDFHWYRLKIGHVLLENFLKRLESVLHANIGKIYEMEQKGILSINGMPGKNDPNAEFISVLRDAFFPEDQGFSMD